MVMDGSGEGQMMVRWSGEVQVRVKSILSMTLVDMKLVELIRTCLGQGLGFFWTRA